MNAAIILSAYAGGCAALLAGDLLRRSDPDGASDDPPLAESIAGAVLWPLLAMLALLEAVAQAGRASGAEDGDAEG
jgi:hypothetical protein